ncbi:MAG: hypothetical protein ACK42C_05760 [Aquificaceae bacterium]|jgi:ATP-dependent RNA circularization protein (DNA/RNA ligase family)
MIVQVRVKLHRGDVEGIIRRVFICPATSSRKKGRAAMSHINSKKYKA